MVDQTLGLRARKKLDTRRALSDAALELAFERSGLENVTRDEIAERANVSLRTFNNYFSNKYDALAYRQVERLRRSLAAFRSRPVDEPLLTSIAEAVLDPLDAEGATDLVPTRGQLAAVRKLVGRPEFQVAVSKGFSDWVDAIAERTGTDPVHDMYPRLVAGVVRAVVEAAMDEYVAADPPVAVTAVLRRGFADVAAGLPEPRRRN